MRGLLPLLLLASCAAAAPPAAPPLPPAAVAAIVPGATTRTTLQACCAPVRRVRFDSGYEAWLYLTPAAGGGLREFLVLIGPDGVVRRAQAGAPAPAGGAGAR